MCGSEHRRRHVTLTQAQWDLGERGVGKFQNKKWGVRVNEHTFVQVHKVLRDFARIFTF